MPRENVRTKSLARRAGRRRERLPRARDWIRQIKEFGEKDEILLGGELVVDKSVVGDHSDAVLYIAGGECGSAEENEIWPPEGRASSAVIFSSVVLPEPLWPQVRRTPPPQFRAKPAKGHAHSVAFLDTGKADLQTAVRAAIGANIRKDACGAATPDGSALNQFAQHLFGAAALPGVLLVRNGPGLSAPIRCAGECP